MVAHSHRLSRRRVVDASTAADGYLAAPFHHLSDPGLARRRHNRSRPARTAGGRGCRLVVRLRLFSRRALLDRPCISGGRQDVRLAPAIRGDCTPGRHGRLHGTGARPGATDLDAWCDTCARARGLTDDCGVAARSPVQRLSLECLWLRTDLSPLARPGSGPHRHLGPHVSRRRGLFVTCRARR